MRFQRKSAIAYMFRNFWKLVYVTLPVSVLMAFFVSSLNEVVFMQMLVRGELTNENIVPRFTQAMTVLRFGNFWWVSLIAFVILAFTVSLMVVKIDRHMRIGVMPALPLKRAFMLFPVTLLLLACYFAVFEIAMLLGVGIAYVTRLFGNVVLSAVVGVAVCFVLRLLLSWIFMLLILALPLKYSDNYPLNVGLSYSVRIMSKQRKLVWGLSFAYVLGRCLIYFLAYLLRPYGLEPIPFALAYFVLITFTPCLSYKLFHDSVGGERRDVAQIMFN